MLIAAIMASLFLGGAIVALFVGVDTDAQGKAALGPLVDALVTGTVSADTEITSMSLVWVARVLVIASAACQVLTFRFALAGNRARVLAAQSE
jgi:hypothetical protein